MTTAAKAGAWTWKQTIAEKTGPWTWKQTVAAKFTYLKTDAWSRRSEIQADWVVFVEFRHLKFDSALLMMVYAEEADVSSYYIYMLEWWCSIAWGSMKWWFFFVDFRALRTTTGSSTARIVERSCCGSERKGVVFRGSFCSSEEVCTTLGELILASLSVAVRFRALSTCEFNNRAPLYFWPVPSHWRWVKGVVGNGQL